jgi:hypothetical protein
MMLSKLGRLSAAAILVIGMTGGTVAVAGPAGAEGLPPPQCKLFQGMSGDSTEVSGWDYEQCIPGGDTYYNVFISEFVTNPPEGWVVVAVGTGFATYKCKGTTDTLFRSNVTTGNYTYPCD